MATPLRKTEASAKGLAGKLAEIIGECRYVQKTGKNVAQKYSYVKGGDLLGKVAPALAARNVCLIPRITSMTRAEISRTSGGAPMMLTEILVDFELVDGDSGESLTVTVAGAGTDTGDKGCYKAMTGATKYFLLTTFMIETGDDPEKEHEVYEEYEETQRPVPVQKPIPSIEVESVKNECRALAEELLGKDNKAIAAHWKQYGNPNGGEPTAAQYTGYREILRSQLEAKSAKPTPAQVMDVQAPKLDSVQNKKIHALCSDIWGKDALNFRHQQVSQRYGVADTSGLSHAQADEYLSLLVLLQACKNVYVSIFRGMEEIDDDALQFGGAAFADLTFAEAKKYLETLQERSLALKAKKK